jgi:hypothetical protein
MKIIFKFSIAKEIKIPRICAVFTSFKVKSRGYLQIHLLQLSNARMSG